MADAALSAATFGLVPAGTLSSMVKPQDLVKRANWVGEKLDTLFTGRTSETN